MYVCCKCLALHAQVGVQTLLNFVRYVPKMHCLVKKALVEGVNVRRVRVITETKSFHGQPMKYQWLMIINSTHKMNYKLKPSRNIS